MLKFNKEKWAFADIKISNRNIYDYQTFNIWKRKIFQIGSQLEKKNGIF